MTPMSSFDRIFADGRDAVLTGRITLDAPPADGGRWGLSIVLLPSGALADRLNSVTDEAIAVAGDHHWRSGGGGAVHVTVRALEPFRTGPPADRGLEGRYVAALQRSTRALPPIALRFDGVSITPSSIHATATSLGDGADELRRRLGRELDHDGWLETGWLRDPIWYATLVHFTGPIIDPTALVDWVSARRVLDIGAVTFEEVHLCRWHFDHDRMMPTVIATALLSVR